MANHPYLFKRNHTWFIRVAVPRKLQASLGKKHIVETTGNRNIDEAKMFRDFRVPEIKKAFAGGTLQPSNQPVSQAAELIDKLQSIRENVREGNLDDETANEIVWDIVEKYENDSSSDLSPDAIATINAALKGVQNPDKATAKEVLDEHLKHIESCLVKSSVRQRATRVERLLEFLGDGVFIADISKSDIVRYMQRVLREKYDNQTTIRNHLGDISAFFSWCLDLDYTDVNPVVGVKRQLKTTKRATRDSESRRAWTEDELCTVMEKLKGHPQADSWLPMVLILLYTGARRTEIAELLKEDVTEDRFKIHEGKTKAAARDIPIHPVIASLVKQLMDTAGDYLIPDLKRGGVDNKRGHHFSNLFSKFLRRQVGIADKGVVLHSLRNTFITAALEAGVEAEKTERIVGHKAHDMQSRYSRVLKFEVLQEAMGKISHGPRVAGLANQISST